MFWTFIFLMKWSLLVRDYMKIRLHRIIGYAQNQPLQWKHLQAVINLNVLSIIHVYFVKKKKT